MTPHGKYARLEIERRWLVDLARVPGWQQLPASRIEDLYLRGTFLRLRKVVTIGEGVVFKLGRKERAGDSPHSYVTNLRLESAEHEALDALEGLRIAKTRHRVAGGALDVPEDAAHPVVFEREFASVEEAAAYVPPDFVGAEITERGTLTDLLREGGLPAAASGAGRRHRIGAGVLVRQDDRVLLVHCHRPGVYDFWVAPGGGARELEDLVATARREAFEECGLHVKVGRLAYVEEFHSPIARYCKLWFAGEVEGGTLQSATNSAASEWVVEARFVARGELAGLQVFPSLLEDVYWADSDAGFPAPRYLGLREMTFW